MQEAPLIIGDDGSSPATVYRMGGDFLKAHVIHSRKQRGCSHNINKIYSFAEEYADLDYLLFTVNDVKCTRPIDFPALLEYMKNTPEVGQVQFMRFKGKLGDPKRERADFNWTTREPVKYGEWEQVGYERIRKTNYSFCNMPAITRLHQCDITKGTLERERRKGETKEKFPGIIECMWVRNWHNTGLVNYETDPAQQPFLGLDIDVTNRTKGLKV
jgi:hypothetical protein